jgi:hypothetical protein
MSDNINLSDSNYDFEEELVQEETLAYEEGKDSSDDIRIWAVPTDTTQKLVFVMIGNITVTMPEARLLSLTKATQIAAKKLLNID